MGLSDALSNLVNKIGGGGNGAGTPEKTSSTGGANGVRAVGSGTGGNNGNVSGMAEEAIGIELAGVNKENISAKSAEEKASSAIEDLMGKLGLSEEGAEKLNGIKDEINTELDKYVEEKILEENDKTIEDAIKEMIKVDIPGQPSFIDKMKDYFEIFTNDGLTMKEAKTYIEGEAEIQKLVQQEQMKNIGNADFDAEAYEAEVRESYAKVNPEYAAAMEEAQAVEAQFDEAMSAEYNTYCEQNPQPVFEDFDNPQEYATAMTKWTERMNDHLEKAEEKYKAENVDYRVLSHVKEAKELSKKIGTGGIYNPIYDPSIGIVDGGPALLHPDTSDIKFDYDPHKAILE